MTFVKLFAFQLASLVALSVQQQDVSLGQDDLGNNKKIVGGNDASLGEYPFFVSPLGILCGAALIHEDIAIGAAHCVGLGFEPGSEVIVGAYELRNAFTPGAVVRTVEQEVIHPEYVGRTALFYDVALIKLSSPVTTIEPIRIAPSNPPSGAKVTVIGFGGTENVPGRCAETELASTLQEIERIVDTSRCTATEHWICAYKREGDSGPAVGGGDSGGPVFYKGELVGVVSAGLCSGIGKIDAYTNLTHSLEWINEQICELSDNPPDSCPAAQPTAPPTSQPTPSPTLPPHLKPCSNNPVDWANDVGETCGWYEENDGQGCPDFGDSTGTNGITANDACCWCGGGIGSLPTTSPTRAPPTTAPTTVLPADCSSKCCSSSWDLLNAQFADMDVLPDSETRRYMLCPGTNLQISKFDYVALQWEGEPPVYLVRPNSIISCGEDGSLENDCVVDGSATEAHMQALWGGPFFDRFLPPLENVTIQGLTFTGQLTGVLGTAWSVTLGSAGSFTFARCHWKDVGSVGAMFLDALPGSFVSQELYPLGSMRLAIEHSVFENIRAEVLFTSLWGNKITIRNTCFLGDIRYSGSFAMVSAGRCSDDPYTSRFRLSNVSFGGATLDPSETSDCPANRPIAIENVIGTISKCRKLPRGSNRRRGSICGNGGGGYHGRTRKKTYRVSDTPETCTPLVL